jgi:hypothetical protein
MRNLRGRFYTAAKVDLWNRTGKAPTSQETNRHINERQQKCKADVKEAKEVKEAKVAKELDELWPSELSGAFVKDQGMRRKAAEIRNRVGTIATDNELRDLRGQPHMSRKQRKRRHRKAQAQAQAKVAKEGLWEEKRTQQAEKEKRMQQAEKEKRMKRAENWNDAKSYLRSHLGREPTLKEINELINQMPEAQRNYWGESEVQGGNQTMVGYGVGTHIEMSAQVDPRVQYWVQCQMERRGWPMKTAVWGNPDRTFVSNEPLATPSDFKYAVENVKAEIRRRGGDDGWLHVPES